MTDTDDLLARLDDLIVQATKERSHYYVKAVATLAAAALREMQTENARLNALTKHWMERAQKWADTGDKIAGDWRSSWKKAEVESARLMAELQVVIGERDEWERHAGHYMDERDALRQDAERYRKAFEHYHVAGDRTTLDQCAMCHLDLRDPIHKRIDAALKERK